jgi:CBS domain-containing protein
MLIGFFVLTAAQAETRQSATMAMLRGVRLAQLMSAPVATAPDWWTVDRFVEEVAAASRHTHLPVLDLQGRPSGVVSLRRLGQVPPASRPLTRVSEVALPIGQVPVAAPEDELTQVMERIAPGAPLRVLVMEGQELVGIVTAHDVSRFLQQRLTLGDSR